MASSTREEHLRTSAHQGPWGRQVKRPCFQWSCIFCCCRFSARKSWQFPRDGALIEPPNAKPETPQHSSTFQGGGKVLNTKQLILSPTVTASTPAAIDEIELGIKNGGTSAKVVEDLRKARMARDKLYELLAIPGNNVCADCGDNNPKWASTNLGVFLCIRCAGVHRSLGTHVSKMLSITLDEWTEEQVATLTALGGNTVINAAYEAKVPEGEVKPTHDSDMAARTHWIERKYGGREYHVDGPVLVMPEVAEYERSDSAVGMVEFVGILKVRVISGKGLAVRDVTLSSDPYVVLSLGNQKVHTRVIQQNLNPVWNETLMLSVPSTDMPLKLEVYDKDTMLRDDAMGEATISLVSLAQATTQSESPRFADSMPSPSARFQNMPSQMWSLNRATDSVHEASMSSCMSFQVPSTRSINFNNQPSSPSVGSSSFASCQSTSAKQHLWVKLEKVERGAIELELELMPLSQEG